MNNQSNFSKISSNNKSTLEKKKVEYNAADIEVLEGLEPVRKRPGMYIGGVDEGAMHHLVTEVMDNCMDEVVAGFATTIHVVFNPDFSLTIRDDGRGIPVDPHPKFPDKSALEVILTTLHSGAKFSNKIYETSGGLHGVGISVVNALSSYLMAVVVKGGEVFAQEYARGTPTTLLKKVDKIKNFKAGTSISFKPDVEIFGNDMHLNPAKVFALIKSKAYLVRGVMLKWNCDEALAIKYNVPIEATISFPNGISDYLKSKIPDGTEIISEIFDGNVSFDNSQRIEWAIMWADDGFVESYCNTIRTPLGGAHEQSLRTGILRAIKAYAEQIGNKKASILVIEDILCASAILVSIFIRDPIFQGQTKEKLLSTTLSKQVENAIKDRFEHWLTSNKQSASLLLEKFLSNADYRLSRKNERNVNRKTAIHKLRLPGKLADCSIEQAEGTEIFLVEGESAGGSAKQARDRNTQAILPLRGKILNIANANLEKISNNSEISDIEVALACGVLNHYSEKSLRYEKVIIMTDADVDGAHIATLLMTFFFRRMPKLIDNGHLYLAVPPLYKVTQGDNSVYAKSEEEKNVLVDKLTTKSKVKIEISRFKGLGEMTAPQLKYTTMNSATRQLLRLKIDRESDIEVLVENLMGKKAESRFKFITENAHKFELN